MVHVHDELFKEKPQESCLDRTSHLLGMIPLVVRHLLVIVTDAVRHLLGMIPVAVKHLLSIIPLKGEAHALQVPADLLPGHPLLLGGLLTRGQDGWVLLDSRW